MADSPESHATDKIPNEPHHPEPGLRRRSYAGLASKLRDQLSHYGGHLAVLALIVLGAFVARSGLRSLPADAAISPPASSAASTPTQVPVSQVKLADLPAYATPDSQSDDITRTSDIHTIIPDRPRMKVVTYKVKQGDTLFGIADQYGLKPETILWGNYDTLKDDVHFLSPGQKLNILPVDGTYYKWHDGDTLRGVASFFGVTPEDILDWPGNNLPADLDPEKTDIAAGTMLVVPGGHRDLVSWQAPRIYRSNPAVAKVAGPGFCGQISDGAIGTGSFVWPTPGHWISGYHFIPGIHPGIDIGGAIGNAIYAADSGVVVYAGWNTYGYGNLIIIDHGNGWQTVYGHLSVVGVQCGQSVFQGSIIGAMGCTGNCTGPHLHFEMHGDQFGGPVNPLQFLP
jgi:murein DD-endopeptidase MepM/ murein hydrolase activator NlpD